VGGEKRERLNYLPKRFSKQKKEKGKHSFGARDKIDMQCSEFSG
jgi:hypothetical protein